MWPRSIIRTCSLVLLLLCIGGWGLTYVSEVTVSCQNGKNEWAHLVATRGKFILVLENDSFFATFAPRASNLDVTVGSVEDHEALGECPNIGFWFPTALAAIALFIAWRVTRAPTDSKTAFPVELKTKHD